VSRLIKGEFPPRLWEAGLQPHGFCLFHQCSDDPFRATILLVCMRNALEDLNPFVLEHCRKSFRRVLSSSIRHPFLYSFFIFCLNHCKELLGGRECCVFGAQVYGPCMGGEVVKEDN
jgi:hypothetical protein